jgi:predicted CXXCH cytochrome family protein
MQERDPRLLEQSARDDRFAARSFVGSLALIALMLTAGLVQSCMKPSGTIVAPPAIAGAEFVGSDTCATCHDELAEEFQGATHALLQAKGEQAEHMGCESCHGPGSLHVEAGGGAGTIINPGRSPEVCFQCHLNKRADFSLPHTHPLTGGPLALSNGGVTCADCHNPHKGPAVPAGGTSLLASNDTCFQCHTAQRGPFVFEHEAVREGCVTCHAPHGSVNEKMLTERNATLCLKCHFQEQTAPGQIRIGGRDHTSFLSRGTCFSAGCHEAVHGSQVSSSLRF